MDACLRLKLPLRLAPSGIHPLTMESHIAGRVLPVRHLARRSIDEIYTFRQHLGSIGGAIEE